MKNKIICVDDEIDNLDALERLLRKQYIFLRASSGKDALSLLDQHPDIATIISDQRMPEMTGVELLEKSIQTHPQTTRILLTGYTDIESVIEAVNKGNIFRYVTKPWDPHDLSNTTRQAVEKYNLIQEITTKNTELAKALEDLKTLDEAKSKFMILINHELKTPLTVILNYLELVKEQTQDSVILNFVSKSYLSALRLKEIIDDVLLIMRGATNQIKLDSENLKLASTIENTFSTLKMEAAKKNLKLEIRSAEQSVFANKQHIEKILRELFKNAITWAKENTIITAELKLFSPDHLECSITNNGPPVKPTIIEKIHQPFKLPENIMNHSKGLGLGLSIVETLLKLHNSQLTIENLPDSVRFKFILKLT
jgi:signal transduction histidine kinase